MNIREMLNDCGAGTVRIGYVSNYPQYPLSDILIRFGLKSDPDCLEEVDQAKAIHVVTALLWKDLAYGTELMPKDRAISYAQEFVRGHAEANSRFYTNGRWHFYHERSGADWAPFTSATFDGGILIVSDRDAACFWAEQED